MILDIETRSQADLEEVSQWNYSLHPSTDVLVLCWYDGKEYHRHDLSVDRTCPEAIKDAIRRGDNIAAWGTAFEYSLWINVLHLRYGWPLPADVQWRDVMVVSLCSGFPAKLEQAAKALKLEQQKDTKGKSLINFFSVPITSGTKKGQFRNPADHPERYAEFIDYCEQDVRTTVAIADALPPLSASEEDFWLRTWAMNIRGMQVDLALVNGLSQMVDTSRHLIGDKLEQETDGQITLADISNHGKILRFVRKEGVDATSVDKKAVKAALAMDLPESARTVLEARSALGQSSVNIIDKIARQSGTDQRMRFMFRHHGTLTGRDSSFAQTIPRGGKFNVEQLVNDALTGDTDSFIKHAYQTKGKQVFDPMGAIVTCLRGCFTASPGNVLLQCDWNAVEPRMISWLAGEEKMLNDFREIDAQPDGQQKIDIYMKSAAPFFGMEPKDIKGDYRQAGKVYILQNIYGAGWKSVQRAAKDQHGLSLDEDTCRLLVDVFRATYTKIIDFGRNMSKAAITCIKNPGKVLKVGKIAFCFDGAHLRMRLPSGRKITYPFARVRESLTPWGSVAESIAYWGSAAQSKQWMEFDLYDSVHLNHATQGSCACLMRDAVKRIDNAGIPHVLRAHDELLGDSTPDRFDEFKALMLTVPEWADGLPLNGAGWIGPRFKKD